MTPKFKRLVQKSWLEEFKDLSKVGSIKLGRFVGPLYQGIAFDRDSSNEHYYPTFHISHFMLVPDSFPLIMKHRLQNHKGVDFRVTVHKHETELGRIFDEFRSQIPLPIEGDLNAEFVIDKLMSYRSDPFQGEQYDQYFIAMTIFGWLGDVDSQKHLWSDIQARLEKESSEFKQSFFDKGEYNLFKSASRVTREKLEAINVNAIEQHNLHKLKHFELCSNCTNTAFA